MLQSAACSLQAKAKRKEKNGSHQGILLVNWERIGGGVTDDCWEAANATYLGR